MAKRLIVNADDFGRSPSINRAVSQAHQQGILTTASLMVNEDACEEAVRLAHEHPTLGVGLHLSLVGGQAALSAVQAPGLVDADGRLPAHPVRAGWHFFTRRSLHPSLRQEIHAQFKRFRQTGLTLDHVNGHFHLHLHPVILGILLADAEQLGIRCMRLTRDPLGLSLRLTRGRLGYRLSHWLIYRGLCGRARPALLRRGIRHPHRVFGLLQDSRVDEAYLRRLLPCLPEGDSELYSHPSLDRFRHEYEALVSPEISARVRQWRIELIRYQDLEPRPPLPMPALKPTSVS